MTSNASTLIKRGSLAEFYRSIKDLDQGSDELNAANLESIHEPVSDTKESNILKKELETVDDNSLEDRPAAVNEIRASQYSPKK
jgi:hypothetical protein